MVHFLAKDVEVLVGNKAKLCNRTNAALVRGGDGFIKTPWADCSWVPLSYTSCRGPGSGGNAVPEKESCRQAGGQVDRWTGGCGAPRRVNSPERVDLSLAGKL